MPIDLLGVPRILKVIYAAKTLPKVTNVKLKC